MNVITQPAELIARYVAKKIRRSVSSELAVTFGLVNDDDELVAGVVFTGYAPPSILMHIAAERLSPAFMAAIMDYAFRQLECKRITGLIDADNHRSRRFAEHLGGQLEGIMRDASPSGDVAVYGLLRKDAARWLTSAYTRKLEGVWAS